MVSKLYLCFFSLSLQHFGQASELTTPPKQLVMITSAPPPIAKMRQNGQSQMLVLTSQQHLTQLIDLPSSKHFLHVPAKTSLSSGILATLLAAPLLIPSQTKLSYPRT